MEDKTNEINLAKRRINNYKKNITLYFIFSIVSLALTLYYNPFLILTLSFSAQLALHSVFYYTTKKELINLEAANAIGKEKVEENKLKESQIELKQNVKEEDHKTILKPIQKKVEEITPKQPRIAAKPKAKEDEKSEESDYFEGDL